MSITRRDSLALGAAALGAASIPIIGARAAFDDVPTADVKAPEFKIEKNIARVKEQAKANGLTFPIVMDEGKQIWKAWRTRYWPTVFLIDKKGVVRSHWKGELHLEQAADRRFAEVIDELLAENE